MAPLKGEGGESVKRQPTMAACETESDGEEEYSGCCLFRSRSMSRRGMKGASYSRLESDDPSIEPSPAPARNGAQ